MDFIETGHAPKAIGPYSQGTITNGLLYTAGQVGLDPGTGELVPGDIGKQTARALENLSAVLRAGGSDLAHVLKTTVFLIDMADFAAMNEVYAQAFGEHRPARSTVAVAALPRGARVEIEAVALVSGSQRGGKADLWR
jgi:2-iminobutanoate/2-iminopropanoate deaminase